MAVDAGPGPEREAVTLQQWEADAFMLIVEYNTHASARYQLSYALRQIRIRPSTQVINGFHLNARRIWRATGRIDFP
jgi:hypothetical protein